jgi:hypothetical protein
MAATLTIAMWESASRPSSRRMCRWVFFSLHGCAPAKPGPQRWRSWGARREGRSGFLPGKNTFGSSRSKIVFCGRSQRAGESNQSAAGDAGKTLYGSRTMASPRHRSDVRVCLRRRRSALGHPSLATGVDRQLSSAGLPGIANVFKQRVCSRTVQRVGYVGYLDWILGSDPLSRRDAAVGRGIGPAAYLRPAVDAKRMEIS